jgi:hypothetical protein
MSGDDGDLYEAFAAVRREEEAWVPAMPELAGNARERGRRRLLGKLVAVGACLAMVIAAAVWMMHGSRVRDEGFGRGGRETAASITAWKPATDFLLDTPGRELLHDVPAVGEWHGAVLAPGLGESHRRVRVRKQVLH